MITGEPQSEKQKDKAMGTRMLHAWFTAFKNVKLYKADHPSTKESARKLALVLNNEIFRDKLELSIQNTDGLFIISDALFIEESLAHYDLLHALEEHGIGAFTFTPGISEDEIIASADYLLKKKLPGVPDPGYVSDHIRAPSKSRQAALEEMASIRKSGGTYTRISELYKLWFSLTENIFEKLVDEQSLSLPDISTPMDMIMDELHQNPASFSSLVSTMPITNLHIQHAMHSMIFSLFIGHQLSIDPNNLKTLGLSALLHDMGRLFLPADFSTGYRLSPGDVDFIQLHTRDGASYLAGVSGLPMTIVRTALEHHVGYDGKGYPTLPGNQKPRFFSQIVGLADFASWATVSENFYSKPISLHRLVRTLLARSGTQFDPLLVKVFIPFFGLYPPGSQVKLSTGETAVVIEPNLRNVGRPLVAMKNAAGNFEAHWLTRPSPEGSAQPYEKSIAGIIGRTPSFELYYDLISETSDVKN